MSAAKYVPGAGAIGAQLMILSDCPSYEDTHAGKLFTHNQGRELDKLLKDAGINRNDCWVTSVSKFHVPPNLGQKKTPFHIRAQEAGVDIEQQLQELRVEISDVKPNVILALGSSALWAITGRTKIAKLRGSLLWGVGTKVVATYHPKDLILGIKGAEFKGFWNRQIMVFDCKRAWDERHTPTLELPHRTLQICHNSHELATFLDRYKDKKKLSVDIEANGTCLPICIGLAFSKSHGMTVPLWNEDDISSIPDSDLSVIWTMLADILWEKDIVGQNFNYDRDKIRRFGFGIRKVLSDTMLKAFAINPELPKGLAFNTSIYTREPFYKDEGMYEGSTEDLLLGCARDACVTYEVDEAMEPDLDELGVRKFYENFLMKLPDLYLEIENNGFRVDKQERDRLVEKYVRWDEQLGYDMFKLAGGHDININSPVQVYDFLFNQWKLPRRNGVGEDELTALLNLQNGVRNPDQRLWIEKCLERRKVKKAFSTYLCAIPDYDGKMKTTCFMCLETGRTSTGQQEPPIRPLVDTVGRGVKKDMKPMGTAFQTLTKHGDIGADIRGMYLPDEGEVFVQLDSSQAEARVVFNLATDEQALKDIDEHDYHALTASWFFGGTESDHSKKIQGDAPPTRFIGKTLRHAGHLGAGKRRAATSVNTDARKYKVPLPRPLSESEADTALKIFHMKQPKIRGIFHAGVIEQLKAERKLTAPLPYGIDADRGGVRIFYERWGDDLFREAFSYLPQRAVTDNTKAAGIRIKTKFKECKVILESHDALLFSVRIEYLDDFIPIAKKEMERPINFSACSLPRRFLKIPCEVEIGENYKDFKKFKFPVPETVIEVVTEVRQPATITEQFTVQE